jgi:hypothetical protein
MAKKEDAALTVQEEMSRMLAAEAASHANLERPAISNISLRAGVMSYMDQPVPDNNMDVIVVGWATERTLYTTPFDADNIVPPDCYALSIDGKDMAPADNVPNPPHPTCAGCPNDEWGSGRGRGKACGERRRLLVMPAGALEQGVEGAEVAMLKVPVTSIRNWSGYVNKLRSGLQRPAWAVVTNISVKPDPKTQFKVLFNLSKAIEDNDVLMALRDFHNTADTYVLQPFDMTPPEEQPENGKF